MNDNNLSGKKEIALGDYIVNKVEYQCNEWSCALKTALIDSYQAH
jgi:hypothetical protein